MIDHVLGRPSVKFRKIQVLAVVCFWSAYLYRGNRHGPPILRRISALLSKRLTAWQTLVITLLWLYLSRNFGKLVGLECPEPLANLYTRSYFRATWVTTALDAGFWSAMPIKRKWARDLCSIIFTVYYLICAEQADEKVRKVRATVTVDHLRVSWNKGTSPYISLVTNLMRPRLTRYPPRAIRIPRPQESSYKDPVEAWLYFDGPLSALKKYNKLVLDIPGGGFVAMNPRNHDDKLLGWAGKTGLPVLSLDYKKAPEYPYPYALNECYDVYHMIMASRGRCVGLSGEEVPKVVVSGDSAGGNLAVGMVLMVLQSGSTDSRRWHGEQHLPPPEGMVLIYPALDMNIGNWMTDEQMALIRDRKTRKTNEGILRRKSDDYRHLAPNTPIQSDDEGDEEAVTDDDTPRPHPRLDTASASTITDENLVKSPSTAIHLSAAHTGVNHDSLQSTNPESGLPTTNTKPTTLKTRLAMSSMISYFNDRILTPELMRAMIILYIGPHNRPDFSTDFLLSPLLAPESLLAQFPKTHFLTGERDPLVDDTVIFAGRIRQAKVSAWRERRELGLLDKADARSFRASDHVDVVLVPGISHGFLQFVSVFPEGWNYISKCARWMRDIFEHSDAAAASTSVFPIITTTAVADGEPTSADANGSTAAGFAAAFAAKRSTRHHRRTRTLESSGDEDRPLEMTLAGSRRGAAAAARARGARGPELEGVRGWSKGGYYAHANGSGGGRRGDRDARGRRRSLVSLASEDDLVGRRMRGLTGSLMRDPDVEYGPGTP